jgi:copper resistance protein C
MDGELSTPRCMEYVTRSIHPMTLLRSKHIARTFVALLTLAGAVGTAAAAVHLALVKSEPANTAVVGKAPQAITLWFSQAPNVKLTRLVLTRARDTVKTGTATALDSAGKQIRIPVNAVLSQGKYDVNWRTLARDGHAVSGKFTFTLDTATAVRSGSSSTAPAPR